MLVRGLILTNIYESLGNFVFFSNLAVTTQSQRALRVKTLFPSFPRQVPSH